MTQQVTFSTGAIRGSDVSDFVADVPVELILAVAKALEDGKAKGYARDNWRKGFPVRSVIAHLLVHILKYSEGDTSEDHLGHAAFNLAVLLRQRDRQPELDDRFKPSEPDDADMPPPNVTVSLSTEGAAEVEEKLRNVLDELEAVSQRPLSAIQAGPKIDPDPEVREPQTAPCPAETERTHSTDPVYAYPSGSARKLPQPAVAAGTSDDLTPAMPQPPTFKGMPIDLNKRYWIRHGLSGNYFHATEQGTWTNKPRTESFLGSELPDILAKYSERLAHNIFITEVLNSPET